MGLPLFPAPTLGSLSFRIANLVSSCSLYSNQPTAAPFYSFPCAQTGILDDR